ncbi:NblA protein [Gracilaria domingensis]|nr:NblA protein [Gracilaria domingensis]
MVRTYACPPPSSVMGAISALSPLCSFILPLPISHGNQTKTSTFYSPLCKRPRSTPKHTTPQFPRAVYQPSDEDKAEALPETPNELTLAQQLLMKQYEEQVERMTGDECRKLAVEVVRQMMVKDNIMKKMLNRDVNFGVEPPDPEDMQND